MPSFVDAEPMNKNPSLERILAYILGQSGQIEITFKDRSLPSVDFSKAGFFKPISSVENLSFRTVSIFTAPIAYEAISTALALAALVKATVGVAYLVMGQFDTAQEYFNDTVDLVIGAATFFVMSLVSGFINAIDILGGVVKSLLDKYQGTSAQQIGEAVQGFNIGEVVKDFNIGEAVSELGSNVIPGFSSVR